MPDHTVSPEPTEEEAAAIAAAVQAVLASGGAAEPEGPRPEPMWRFSGRWWNRPPAQARLRPWRP